MKAAFREYDIVRVVRLLARPREYTSSEGFGRDPQVGDVGTIVHDYEQSRGDRAAVCVECTAPTGHCIWLADFDREELELIAHVPDGKTPPDIEAEVFAVPTSEGGRKTAMLSGYRPTHDFGKNGHLNDGRHEYPGGGQIQLGATGRALIWLLCADENFGLLTVGDTFTVQEGNRIVGRGRITALLNWKLSKSA